MTDEMRILTVRQPWAWAIIHSGKDVENRVRNIAGDYRGPVAIHAGLALFEEEGGAFPEVQRAIWIEEEGYVPTDDQLWEVADLVDPEDPRFVYGAILGVVDLTDVHRGQGAYLKPPICWRPADYIGWVPYDGKDPYPHFKPRICSPWAEQDGYHLTLANPRPLTEPIPYRGALGLRRLDPTTINQITAALAAEETTP